MAHLAGRLGQLNMDRQSDRGDNEDDSQGFFDGI